MLLILTTAGVVYSAIKRDPFILLWIGSFVIFFVLIGWVQYFHWIPVLPVFCIAAARVIDYASNKIGHAPNLTSGALKNRTSNKGKLWHIVSPYLIISGIGIFGLVSTTLLISTNVNSSFFEIYAAIIHHISPSTNGSTIDNSTTRVNIIGSHWWLWSTYWIPNYVFHKNITLIDPHFDPLFKKPIESKKVLFILDQNFIQHTLSRDPFVLISANNAGLHIERLKILYRDTTTVASLVDNLGPYDSTKFPYTTIPVMILLENRGIGPIQIKAN